MVQDGEKILGKHVTHSSHAYDPTSSGNEGVVKLYGVHQTSHTPQGLDQRTKIEILNSITGI